jgi:hypothetical protein
VGRPELYRIPVAQQHQSERTTVISVRIDASGYVAQFNALREL